MRFSTRPKRWAKQPSISGATVRAGTRQPPSRRPLGSSLAAKVPSPPSFAPSAHGPSSLPAELDTALQAATGSTDKQIAELMSLSVRTVENRLHRAYQKLGISHRRELAEALRDLPGV